MEYPPTVGVAVLFRRRGGFNIRLFGGGIWNAPLRLGWRYYFAVGADSISACLAGAYGMPPYGWGGGIISPPGTRPRYHGLHVRT